MDLAFQYAQQNKMEQESDYPYKAYDGTCAYKEVGDVKVSTFTDVTVNSPSAL
jgi:hypothetical protein